MAWKQDFCGSENNNYFYLSPFLAEWAAIKHLQKKSLLAAQRHFFCLQGSPFILCPSWAAWSSVAAPEMAKNQRSPIPQLQRGLCRANTTGGEWELVWLSPAKPLTLCRVLQPENLCFALESPPLLIVELQQLPTSVSSRNKASPSKGRDLSSATQGSAVGTSSAKLLQSPPETPGNHINSFKHYVMTSFKHTAPKGLILDQGITIPHAFVTNLIGGNDLLHNTA